MLMFRFSFIVQSLFYCFLLLQVCNEFQKKQETTSTKICQNLAAEARKAGDFDKKNNVSIKFVVMFIPYELRLRLIKYRIYYFKSILGTYIVSNDISMSLIIKSTMYIKISIYSPLDIYL